MEESRGKTEGRLFWPMVQAGRHMIEGFGPGEWIEDQGRESGVTQGCLPAESRAWSKSRNESETRSGLLGLVSGQDAKSGAQDGPEEGGRQWVDLGMGHRNDGCKGTGSCVQGRKRGLKLLLSLGFLLIFILGFGTE